MHCAELSTLLHRALEVRLETLMKSLSEAGWQEQPEGLHDVRVASRRLRAVLDLVTPDLYPAFKRQGRNLKKLTQALGRTRERDVHLSLLKELGRRVPSLTRSPALEHALEALEERCRRARRAMARDLDRIDLDRLSQLLEVPSLPDPFRMDDLTSAVWRALEPWLEGAFPAPALLDQEDVQALHFLRIRVKRLRYALEILTPAFALVPEGQLKQLHTLQTALGDHHDLATLEGHVTILHQGLVLRNRPILAAGTLDLHSLLDEDRTLAFEQFRALAVALDPDGFRAGLLRDLEGNPRP